MVKPKEESGPTVYHSTDTMGGHWLTVDSMDGKMQHILSRAPGVDSGKKTLALEKKHKKRSAATGSRVRAHLGHISPQKGIIRRHQGRAPAEPILTPAPLPKEFLELHEADLHDNMHGHQDRLVDKINSGEATPAEHIHFSKIRNYLNGLVDAIKGRGGKTEEALEKEERLEKERRVENAAYKYSSTQFNIADAGYNRTQGSPLPTIQYLIDLIDDNDLAKDGKENNPHITVKYGLHADDPGDVRMVLEEWTTDIGGRTVGATLGDVSFFPGEEFDVVKIDVESECLRSLNKALSELPHTDTHPKYNPHLTLAYVKPGLGKKYEGPGLEGHEILLHVLAFSDKDRNLTYIDLWKLGNTNGETY